MELIGLGEEIRLVWVGPRVAWMGDTLDSNYLLHKYIFNIGKLSINQIRERFALSLSLSLQGSYYSFYNAPSSAYIY